MYANVINLEYIFDKSLFYFFNEKKSLYNVANA